MSDASREVNISGRELTTATKSILWSIRLSYEGKAGRHGDHRGQASEWTWPILRISFSPPDTSSGQRGDPLRVTCAQGREREPQWEGRDSARCRYASRPGTGRGGQTPDPSAVPTGHWPAQPGLPCTDTPLATGLVTGPPPGYAVQVCR